VSSFGAIAAHRPGPVTRNGLAPTRPYRWRAHRPAWMRAAIAAAEAQHGPPKPTCVCGTVLVFRHAACYATCPDCGSRSYGGSPQDPG
jgi:hypothetical protein